MEWLEILKGLGISAAISTVIPIIVTRYFNKKDKKNNDIAELKKFKSEYENITKEILSTLEVLKKDMSLYKESQQALLRDRLIRMYNHYMDKEEMPIYARESLDKMYKQYHELGGNGAIEPLVEKLYNLPTKSPKDDEEI